jgi:hypothetical protein
MAASFHRKCFPPLTSRSQTRPASSAVPNATHRNHLPEDGFPVVCLPPPPRDLPAGYLKAEFIANLKLAYPSRIGPQTERLRP